jgi:dienelactone hydrolase
MAWLVLSYRAGKASHLAMTSDARVTVTAAGSTVSFRPNGARKSTGLILYPGAMVDPIAYAPMARRIAESGYPVSILKTAFRSAPRRADVDDLQRRTLATMAQNGDIKKWVVGGHSKGGALAARFARDHGSRLAGLLLIATSHPKTPEADLSAADYPVLKIYGTNDGLASEAEVLRNRQYLPKSAVLYPIPGGNHAQFADYGRQFGDQSATIGRAEQQSLTDRAVLRFLGGL